ncbi:hypothetical protein N7532_007230 [Penicillium argentinense]|uniref:Endonuclease/exonuclease/phosphatase domain-containing protein n=1 Tax=Penicillium argentinense TaxID=1131581 RepID=A0A9W9F7J0_9EURO|nr:uncharacterized protein N7532_007230 [Penicillium argentinense]KAJ5094939.1 hypothetical protein N7532_007230 [Penicillium argentinense]
MHLFGEEEVHKLDILAIQEPSINTLTEPMTTYSQALGGRFHVVLRPTASTEPIPRVCFFINKRLDPRTWTVRHITRDISTVSINASTGTIHIHNVYNPSPRLSQDDVLREGEANEGPADAQSTLIPLHHALSRSGQHMVVGDFNLHHPQWSRRGYYRTDVEAEDLIGLMGDHGLELLTPRGTTTCEKHERGAVWKTTIDLAWASSTLANRLIRCEAQRQWLHAADHVPVLTEVNIETQQRPRHKRLQWKNADWKAWLAALTPRS